jgi:hypothetical protein
LVTFFVKKKGKENFACLNEDRETAKERVIKKKVKKEPIKKPGRKLPGTKRRNVFSK